jgi:imidazolonepropionase-like amidohydrolase
MILGRIALKHVFIGLASVLLAPSSCLSQSAPSAAHPEKTVYLRAGRLFDGKGDALKDSMVLQIEGERIKDVAPSSELTIPSGAEVIDLTDAIVLPGLIDCHTHLQSKADRFDPIYTFKNTPHRRAFNALLNARKTLEAGFTTVRDLGSSPFLAVDLRNSINEGDLIGPRVVASGPAISITGGHGDINSYSPQTRVVTFPDERDFRIADGVDQVRHVVRAQIKYGVDVIKVHATGGVMSLGDQPGAPQFSPEELKVLVQEAHMGGRKVAAHAHGAEGIKNAVNAGVDSIEHGSLIDDEGIRLMKEKGTYLVADIYNDDFLLGQARELGLPEESVEKEKALGRIQRENFAKAVKAGVKVAFGTDAGIYPHGNNAKQFPYMVKFGLTPAQAIRSATSDAADLIGRAADVGSLVKGHYADVIAVSANPLDDVQALGKVDFVMKGGTVYVDRLTGKHLAAKSASASP